MPPKKPVAAKPAAKSAPARQAAGKAPAAGKAAPPGKKGTPAPTATAKKGTVPAKGKSNVQAPSKPKEKVWTKEDDAARTIQTKVRQHLAKKKLKELKKKKEEYEELMLNLEKEAFAKLVKMEQEKYEKERQKEEEERKRKREEARRKKKMLEAAFEGSSDEILELLKEVKELDDKNGVPTDAVGRALRNKHLMALIECEDANENTVLSEAASGGHCDTIKMLLEKGGDPNSKGQFGRTPLYRAAFAGHLEACELLLQNGADPRIYANDGQTPEQIASIPAIQTMLQEWDVSQTENLLTKLDNAKKQRAEEEKKRREAEEKKLEGKIDEAQLEYDTKNKQLSRAYQELNKRINEHDTCVAQGYERLDITLQAIHDQEDEVEILKMETEKAREILSQAKLKLREQQMEGRGRYLTLPRNMCNRLNAATDEELPGVKVNIRELDDVLLRDVGNKIKDSGSIHVNFWPLMIDPSGQAATFLRYRDTNYINALSPHQMEPERVRMAVLGSIRYGKYLVLDMMEVDMFDTVGDVWDNIQKGLLSMIMDKTILQEENCGHVGMVLVLYLKMVKESDGEEYSKNKFNDFRKDNFKFVIITKNPYPPTKLMETTYPIRIVVPT
ncbi:hypothetical protein KUTeg_016290 [Tegillarca granosa]|uniref:Uncharacterized protein n=1 Tax=Tegillarca granosa TaxID=220873 RepID=A0ABQ9EQQ2_TEGGR|nr:hypothetical protein KUTeg_016290 [Tegillarca granosa]